jgi:Ni,Fe-hydrogenase III small subunit
MLSHVSIYFDMDRFGSEFVASPRHANGIVVSGTTTRAMSHALEAIRTLADKIQ